MGAMSGQALVEFEDVNKYFGQTHVLEDITLEVDTQIGRAHV